MDQKIRCHQITLQIISKIYLIGVICLIISIDDMRFQNKENVQYLLLDLEWVYCMFLSKS